MRHVLAQPPFDGRYQVLHLGKPFEPRQFRRLDRPELTHLAEIIAEQIGDHHQFRQFLGAGLQFVGKLRIVRRIGPTRARAFDGAGADMRPA